MDMAGSAKHALEWASGQAQSLGHAVTGTEHLLFGLTTASPITTDVLMRLGVSPAKLLDDITRLRGEHGRSRAWPSYTQNLRWVIENAAHEATARHRNIILAEDLLLTLISRDGTATRILSGMGVAPARIDAELRAAMGPYRDPADPEPPSPPPRLSPLLEKFTWPAPKTDGDENDPSLAYARHVSLAVEHLTRETRDNVLLVGRTGVGEILATIAMAIHSGQIPPRTNPRLLDWDSIEVESSDRGDFYARLREILKEAAAREDILLVIPDADRYLELGPAQTPGSASALLWSLLSRRALQVILTVDDAGGLNVPGSPLERHFGMVTTDPPTPPREIATPAAPPPRVGLTRLPVRAESTVILVGTSAYADPKLPDIPSIANNLADLRDVLTDNGSGAFDPARTHVYADTDGTELPRIAALARDTTDTLLLYFSGHGWVDTDGQLYLCDARTEYDHEAYTAVEYDKIRRIVLNSPARNKVVILDCCYSGRAVDVLSPAAAVGAVLDINGSHVLTATSATRTAHAPNGDRNTAFTAALLELLRDGTDPREEWIRVVHEFPRLEARMRARGLDRPMQRTTGTIGELAIARNPRWTA